MKTLKQIREEYESDQINLDTMPEEFMLEGNANAVPDNKHMPQVLLFRRVTYRLYPNKQVVALYYSSMVDKYLSVPFGPKGNLNLSEAVILDSLDEDWQKVNRNDKTDGLSQAAVNAYRRENPGSKLKTAVTEKNPKGKRAARRKSFCSRMGGMKKRLTSAKTARDPDSRINKALRRWNCEESFREKLYEKRMQQEGVADVLDAGAEAVVPYYGAAKKVYKGDYAGAAKDAAVDTALLATGAVAGKVLGAGARLAGKGISKVASKFGKTAAKPARKVAPTASKPSMLSRVGSRVADVATTAAGVAAGNAASQENDNIKNVSTDLKYQRQNTGAVNSWKRKGDDPVVAARMRKSMTTTVKENKMTDLRNMVNEGVETKDLRINGRSVTINTSMAKRILEVYDSVNASNKKIVEGMLNEDLESFKKLLNFSIKQ